MRVPWHLRLAGVLLATILCGVSAVLCVYPMPACAQAPPEVGDPEIVGWFCPDCRGLVPTEQRRCGCGFSLDGDGATTGDDGTTDGNTTGDGYRPPPRPVTPSISVEERRQGQVYAREKQELLAAFKMPAVGVDTAPAVTTVDANAFSNPMQTVRFQKASGLTEVEWARARACQAEFDSLTRAWPPSEKDAARLGNLITERNTLWAKATNSPDLTNEDRRQLRLKLFTMPQLGKGAVASLTAAALQNFRTPTAEESSTPTENPVVMAMMRQAMVDNSVALVEMAGEEWAGDLLGEAAGDRFGAVLGVAKVIIKAKDDTAEGLAALADVFVGFIPIPQANWAVTGGRIYANTAQQAMNDFMTKSMQFVGKPADNDAFWKELDGEISVNMRAYRKWIGFGD